ncbi:cytochrome P450 [Infundibulicybe gibba]|nr:cytochrome P450 [Infundibulicybe gibba]
MEECLSPAVAHSSTEDDEYDGYFIPKGSIVIGNTWAILHDPEEFPQPEKFRPERYLNADGTPNLERRDPRRPHLGSDGGKPAPSILS